jgi:hypothetical protein
MLCNGVPSETRLVRRFTAEEFYFWLDRRVKQLKQLAKEAKADKK